MTFRLSLLIVCLLIGYSILLFHLYSLQLVSGEYYLARADFQYASSKTFKANRGAIYLTDKNNRQVTVAANKNFPIIYAVPKALDDPIEVANRLAPILGQPADKLLSQLSKKNDIHEPLSKKTDPEVVKKIEDLKIKGIYIDSAPERFYLFGDLAAHVLGFVGPNSTGTEDSGHYGVEELYDSMLKGLPGEVRSDKIISPKSGEDLTLTIDPSIQSEAELILKNLVQIHHGKSGNVIIEEPKTGKILAMGSYPTFDPNNYKEANLSDFLNPAVQQIYEPGSVFKIITMAAGIDSGKITPETTFIDTGTLVVSGKKIQNWDHKAHGKVTMTNVIEQSINIGAAFAERQTEDDTFREYVAKFGFGEKTGVDLPGEIKGDLRQLRRSAPAVAFATASFGQGVAVTPIELINAFSAIANGGALMRPYLNAALEPKTTRRIITPAAAEAVTQMMVSAVDKADVAKIKGYAVAGKTGTAQVPDFLKGGYTDELIHTYVGFGPVKNPRFVILIKLDEPQGAPLAGTTVVPAFRDLAQFILNYYDVPPDRL
jgi:cell division protein FtsI/penicillin-binding protein 2